MLDNISLPTVLANKSLLCVQKVSQHFMLANNVCRLRTCSFFVGQQVANHALWLVGCSKHHGAEWTDASCIDYTNFTSTLSTNAPEQILGAYVFAYKQLNKSLLQQRRRCLLSSPSQPYCCPTKCCRVWHKCLPTKLLANKIVGQQLLVVCLRL